MVLFYSVLATLCVSLISLVGVLTLSFKKKSLHKFLVLMVSLSAGTLMGTVFFHLLPEAQESLTPDQTYGWMLVSFMAFFLLEKILHWQHCHDEECEVHSFGYINLVGDGIHNFMDGMVIAGAFGASVELGVITTLAVILHEIPQEIGDFGVLVHAGFEISKALLFNLISALTAIAGAFVGYLMVASSSEMGAYLLPIAAGGFLYISASDLLPEIRKEAVSPKLFLNFAVFLVGILFVLLVKDPAH